MGYIAAVFLLCYMGAADVEAAFRLLLYLVVFEGRTLTGKDLRDGIGKVFSLIQPDLAFNKSGPAICTQDHQITWVRDQCLILPV